MLGGMNDWPWETLSCVDLKHAILALQVALNLRPDNMGLVEDINGDGYIGIAEAIYILQRIAGPRCD